MYDRTTRLANSLIADRHEAARAARAVIPEPPADEAAPQRTEARTPRVRAIGHVGSAFLHALGHGRAHRPAWLGPRS